jgi:hypothetical protein
MAMIDRPWLPQGRIDRRVNDCIETAIDLQLSPRREGGHRVIGVHHEKIE